MHEAVKSKINDTNILCFLQGLNFVMFDRLGYKAATDDYYQLDNSLIEKVQ